MMVILSTENSLYYVSIVIISVTTVKAIFTRDNSQYLSPVLTPVNMMMAIFGRRNFYKMLATTFAVLILVKSVRTLAHGPEKWSFLSDGTFVRNYEESFWKTLFGAPTKVMTITNEVGMLSCVVNIIAVVAMLFGVIIDKEICLWSGAETRGCQYSCWRSGISSTRTPRCYCRS
jgi:hypothetical protein